MENLNNGEIVALTGATGFIGKHLVRYLTTRTGLKLRALVRRSSTRAEDIRHSAVEIVQVSATDGAALAAALAGVNYVVNLAFDGNNLDANIDAIHALCHAAKTAHVKRIVHLSSAAVYEPLADGRIDETSDWPPPVSNYIATKRAQEKVLLDLLVNSTPSIVILQPAIVYGPYGQTWTEAPLRQLRLGDVFLPREGTGIANTVYVEDVCQSICCALSSTKAEGERILISGPGAVEWKSFYDAYDRLFHTQSTRPLAPKAFEAAKKSLWLKGRQAMLKYLANKQSALWLTDPVPETTLKIREAPKPIFRTAYIPRGSVEKLYSSQAVIDIGKAERLLDYKPTFDFNRGIEHLSQWLR